MDLFVINRHEEIQKQPENEEEKIQNLLRKIEKNKILRTKQREQKKKRVEEKTKLIESTTIIRKKKREKRELQKAFDNAQNISSLCEPEEILTKNIDTEEKLEDNEKLKFNSQIGGFTVLGSKDIQKKEKVKRVLPRWLSEPTVISTNLQNLETKVSEIKILDKSIRKKLKKNGISYFFPVQAVVIPWLLKEIEKSSVLFPRDICVSAPTGSGKTLAFILPIVHCLKSYVVKRLRALIILPTQDLAFQVYKTLKYYTTDTNLSTCIITGKNPFSVEQTQLVEESKAFGFLSKIDILVCTAGRLVDHLKSTKGFNLTDLEFLVIDEADRVLDTVQNDWLYHLEQHMNTDNESYQSTKILNLLTLRRKRPPQKLLFSATLSQDPEKLQKLSLFQPKLFTSIVENENSEEKVEEKTSSSTFVGKYTTPKELTEKYIVCSIDLKPLVLYEFLKSQNLTRTLVFTNSTESAHRLTILLNSMFKGTMQAVQISSDLNIKKKNDLIKSFTTGEINIFVCTDRLARGIDIPDIQCVVSYGAPKFIKTYIHRVGRTARAGQQGLAVTLLHENQLSKFQFALSQAEKTNLEKIDIEEDKLEMLADQYKEALGELKQAVLNEEKVDLKTIKQKKRPRKGLQRTTNKKPKLD